jgi:predicted house-cleaning noncanonical NTP pyrophosphatase (MazG superfamily)
MTDSKLVRDKIPDLIRAEGGIPVVEVLLAAQRRPALLAKLLEEAGEAAAATDGELPEELADVLEVVRALACELGLSLGQVVELADEKRSRRGGFDQGLWLERTRPDGA